MDTSVLQRQQLSELIGMCSKKMTGSSVLRGNKIFMGGNMETKCGAETEGKAIKIRFHQKYRCCPERKMTE